MKITQEYGTAVDAIAAVVVAGSADGPIEAKLEALTNLRYIEARLDKATRDLVAELRTAGATWQQIGGAVLTTRSAAQQKYGSA